MERMQHLLTSRAEVHLLGDRAMRCNHCSNTMNKTEEVVELQTRQTWYECPVCDAVHTVSERAQQPAEQRVGQSLRFSAASPGRGSQ